MATAPTPPSRVGMPPTAEEIAKRRLITREQFERQVSEFAATGRTSPLTVTALADRLRYLDTQHPTKWETQLIQTFQQVFPELAADFASYQDKPSGCACRGKLIAAINADITRAQTALDRALDGHVFLLAPDVRTAAGTALVGYSALIDPTPEAWSTFFQQLVVSRRFPSAEVMRRQYTGVATQLVANGTKLLVMFY